MAILSTISVGDIFYYLIDDTPTHSAPRGSISILDSNGSSNSSALYINNDGLTTWVKMISPSYGLLTTNDNTNTTDFDSQDVGSWYAWNSTATYTLTKGSSFSRQVDATFGDYLRYDGTPTIRALVRQTSTSRGGTGKWMSWQIGPAKNFIVPTEGFSEFHVNDNAATQNASSMRVLEFFTNDSSIASISPVGRENGGPGSQRSYISRHCDLSVIKLDEALFSEFFSEDWESGNFTTEGWTVVNGEDFFELAWSGSSGDGEVIVDGNTTTTSFSIDINNTAFAYTKQPGGFPPGVTAVYQGGNIVHLFGATTVTYNQTTANLQVAITEFNSETNKWEIGTDQNNTSGGTFSAYVSNDGGTTATYDVNAASISHFYKDFTFPSGDLNLTLIFDWKSQGENTAGNAVQYDYGTVVITNTGTTPSAGTEVSTTQATAGGDGRIGADDNDGKFNLGYGDTPGTTWNTESIDLSSYAGQTKRIVFTWVNDGSVGASPGFIVDNIRIQEYNW